MASKAALLLCFNVLFFTVVSSTYVPCNPPPKTPKHPPVPKPPSPKQASCPKDTIKFGVCADVLGLINVQLGKPPKTPCCNLIEGLADLEAAVCLCTALKANVLGINLNVPVNLSLLLNYCGKGVPKGFVVCADVLGLINVQLGKPPKTPCCNLIQGLADLEAAVCLCTALKANVLGINLNVTVNLSLLLNYCGKGVPKGFVCY
ncbi:hypothetical protein JHK86_011912 [Glycine max]|nr:hypothetical protein JHK86_011912 [Glycine max]